MKIITFVLNLLPIEWIKKWWKLILFTLLVLTIVFLFFKNLATEHKLTKCENTHKELLTKLENAKKTQEAKVEIVEKIIEKEVIKYKDHVQYIKEIQPNENLSKCDNAINLIRSNF